VSLLAFTAWQLTAGGILLIPVVLLFAPPMPVPTVINVAGLAWLTLIGAALTYVLWFRGVARLESAAVSPLLFISPLTAAVLGWVFLNQTLTAIQIAGIVFVVGSIWLSQRPARAAGAPIPTTNLRSNR
jgi:probable blue pigment (indigoidine) exporter